MKSKQVHILLLLGLFISLSSFGQIDINSISQVKGLKVGDKIENFSAIDQNNKTFNLETALEKGSVIVIFYRGHWCPVCNKHLSNMQDSLSMINTKGATVIAISPEKIKYASETIEKTGAQFTLLYDKNYSIAELFDVLYKPSGTKKLMYNSLLGANFKDAHSNDNTQLPIPATFIINKNKEIIWRQFSLENDKRSSVKEILSII